MTKIPPPLVRETLKTEVYRADSTDRRNTSIAEVLDGSSSASSRSCGAVGRCGRRGIRRHQRETERLFWMEIAKGLIPIEAAALSSARRSRSGSVWFHNAGGMPPFRSGAVVGPLPLVR